MGCMGCRVRQLAVVVVVCRRRWLAQRRVGSCLFLFLSLLGWGRRGAGQAVGVLRMSCIIIYLTRDKQFSILVYWILILVKEI